MGKSKFTEALEYRDVFFRYALAILSSEEEAKDVVQGVYERLWKTKNDLGKIKNMKVFGITATRNSCLNVLKSKAVLTHSEIDDNIVYPKDPFDELNESERIKITTEIISKLPEQQRSIIVLRDFEELEFDEMEQITGLTKNAIRANLSIARKKVRSSFEKIMSHGIKRI